MAKELHVSTSPHVRDRITTRSIMCDVLIALLPASVFGVIWFGWHALLLIVTCVLTCMLTEYLYQRCMHKKVTVLDGSAAVTGLLLALNLPPELPVVMAMLGSAFAILVVKQLYGGLGQNFMNPALAGRVFLSTSFAGAMTNFAVSANSLASEKLLSAISSATPLALLREGSAVPLKDMFFGTTLGVIGETSALCLLLGGLYLMLRKVISPRIPVSYLLSFVLFMGIFGDAHFDLRSLAAQVCGGGLMLGVFYMATDYVTSPITHRGQIVFGILLGMLTGLFRVFGASAEGVSYAIIIGNLCVPLIERVTRPTAFGREGKRRERK